MFRLEISQISRDRKFLSILADVATQSEELKNSKFFSINVDDSHPVDLKTSSLEEVKYLIEIVFHVSTRDDVLKLFPELLSCVKKYWNDEEIMNGVVKLLLDILMESSEDRVTRLISDGVISTVLVLSGLLFSHNPDTMGLFRIIDFPRNTEYSNHSLAHVLIETVVTTSKSIMSDKSTDNETISKNISNIIRPMIPIMSLVLKEISEDFVNLIDIPPVRTILHLCLDLIKTICLDSFNFDVKDLKLLLTAEIPEYLMTIFEKSPQNKCCSTESEGPSVLVQNCDVFRVLESFIEPFSLAFSPKNLDSQREMMKFFMIWRRFSADERAFEDCGHNLTQTFLWTYLKPSHFDYTVYRRFLCDLEKSPIPSIIQFVSRRTDCIGYLCHPLTKIFEEREDSFKDLFPLIINLPDLLINYLMTNDHVSYENKMKMDNLFQSSTFYRDSQIRRVEPDLVFKLLQHILISASLSQLQELEMRFVIIKKILKLFKKTKNSFTMWYFSEILNDLITKQTDTFCLLSPETLLELTQLIWDKMRISSHTKDKRHPVTTLTYNVSLYVPGSCHIDYTKFLPALLVDLDNIHRFKPTPPGMLTLIWHLVKQPKYKQPYKKLVKLSCDKPVEYASPGKIELAKIFRLISDVIIDSLDHHPAFSEKYYIDLTNCIVSIAQSCTLDEELYVLEDLVSPAIWLLENQSDKKIINHVKKFISILH